MDDSQIDPISWQLEQLSDYASPHAQDIAHDVLRKASPTLSALLVRIAMRDQWGRTVVEKVLREGE